LAAGVLALAGAPAQAGSMAKMSAPVIGGAGATQISTLVQVCSGATGAGAGFSVQWMSAADYAANGSAWYSSDDPRLCKASFSGKASGSRYDLGPGECVTVSLGDLLFDNGASASCTAALACGTDYVVRAFAHASCTRKRSDFTPNLPLSTLACSTTGGGCTYGQDHWRFFNPPACLTHPGSIMCIDWPVTSLTLGTVSYTVDELVSILNAPASDNGLTALVHQLISAKLNIAAGADGSAVATTISAADALVGGLVVPPVGDGFLDPGVTAAYTATLASFNQGAIGPGACGEPDPGEDFWWAVGPGQASKARSLEPLQELLEPRVVAHDVVVGVVLDPVALAPASREDPLEELQHLLLQAQLGAETRGVDERAQVVRMELERAA
jgi:hypothetical protein